LFPIDAPPIEDGELLIAGAEIVRVGPPAHGSATLDLGNVAILPALVNAHTHLEFSQLNEPLGAPGMAFHDWIRAVLDYRQTRPPATGLAIQSGLDESLNSGTVALAEIATCSRDEISHYVTALVTILLSELIGLSGARVQQQLEMARQLVTSSTNTWPSTQFGLSPHAPYTAHYTLVDHVARLSDEWRFLVAMHLAESSEEIQFLRDQSGPIRQLLVERDAWEPDAFWRGMRPLDYLQLLDRAHRSLIIHGNFLDEEEIRFIGSRRHRMSVVFCPRTHAYFRHPSCPLRRMLDADVNVALGTDSRASNPDLSVLSEMRYLAREHSNLGGDEILRMGTQAGAAALGLDVQLGTLTAGKSASFVAIGLPQNNQSEAARLVLDSELPVELVVLQGRLIFASELVRTAVHGLLDG